MLSDKICKTAILVSGGGTNLQAIIDAIKTKKITHASISLVASANPDCFALKRAKNNDIETFVFSSEEELIDKLRKKNIDLIVLAGFLKILSPNFISNYKNRIINIHPSLIPSFSGKGCYGLHVHEKALDYGVKVTGATVHFVNEIPDGGKIIFQKAVEVMDGDTPETLQKRVMKKAEHILLPKAVEKVAVDILKGDI